MNFENLNETQLLAVSILLLLLFVAFNFFVAYAVAYCMQRCYVYRNQQRIKRIMAAYNVSEPAAMFMDNNNIDFDTRDHGAPHTEIYPADCQYDQGGVNGAPNDENQKPELDNVNNAYPQEKNPFEDTSLELAKSGLLNDLPPPGIYEREAKEREESAAAAVKKAAEMKATFDVQMAEIFTPKITVKKSDAQLLKESRAAQYPVGGLNPAVQAATSIYMKAAPPSFVPAEDANLKGRLTYYQWFRTVIRFIWGGPLTLFFSWVNWYNPALSITKEELPIPKKCDEPITCPGAADGKFYGEKDHFYCFHKDGSACTIYREEPTFRSLLFTKNFDNIFQAVCRAPTDDHLQNLLRFFITKLNATEDWQKHIYMIRLIANAFKSRGIEDDNLQKLLELHQHAKHYYRITVVRCILYLCCIPIMVFLPPIGIGMLGYLAIDFGYHFVFKRYAEKVQNFTAKIHQQAIHIIMGTAIAVVAFGSMIWFMRWWRSKAPVPPQHDQGGKPSKFEKTTLLATMVTGFTELLMHVLKVFKIEIPEDVGQEVNNVLKTLKLSTNLARTFVFWNKLDHTDQASWSNLTPFFEETFKSAILEGKVTEEEFEKWLFEQNEVHEDFFLKCEFYMKYWSYLKDKDFLTQCSLFNEWKLGEEDFNVAHEIADTQLINAFDSWSIKHTTEEQEEDEYSLLSTAWNKTKTCWSEKKVPKEVLRVIIGILMLLIGVGAGYYAWNRKKKDEPLVEQGHGRLGYHRGDNPYKRTAGTLNNNNAPTVARRPREGALTMAAKRLGQMGYLPTNAAPPKVLGVKKPNELAGYEYVFLRVGGRRIRWDIMSDQYSQSRELLDLFREAKKANEKVYVMLPVKESPTDKAYVYMQTGYELQPEAEQWDYEYKGNVYWTTQRIESEHLFVGEMLAATHDQAKQNERGHFAYQEDWVDQDINEQRRFQNGVLSVLGLSGSIVGKFRSYQEFCSAIAQRVLTRVVEEAKVAARHFTEESLVGGNLFDITRMSESIFEIRREEIMGNNGHGFVADGKCWTCKHVLLKVGEPKTTALMPAQTYTFRSLTGKEWQDQIVIEQDGGLEDFVTFRFAKTPLPPSLGLSTTVKANQPYDGLGFILCSPLLESLKLRCSVGKVFKNVQVITHFIPTVAGMSGCPITDCEGRVLGMHRGTLQIANQGIPLDLPYTLAKQKPLELAAPSNEGTGSYDQSRPVAYTRRDKWDPIVPIDIDTTVPWTNIRTYESHGQLKSFPMPHLNRYEYLGTIRNFKYKEKETFKEDLIAKVMEEEGLSLRMGKYKPIHPDMESCYRDIQKRDVTPAYKPDRRVLDIAKRICYGRWDHIMKHDEFVRPRKEFYSPVLAYDAVIQYQFNEEGEMVDVYSPLLDLKQQPGFPKNQIFWSAQQYFMKAPAAAKARNDLLFAEPMPKDRLIYTYQTQRKNEFRDIDRVIAKKGRAYYPEDSDFKLQGKQLWYEQEKKFLDAPFWMKRSMYGETTFFGNWHAMMSWLNTFPYQNDEDIKCWDGSFTAVKMKDISDWKISHLHPNYHIGAQNYYEHILHTAIVMPDGAVLKKKDTTDDASLPEEERADWGDQKSGCDSTLSDNSKANDLAMTYAEVHFMLYKLEMDESEICSKIDDHFRHMVLGDDSRVTSIHDDFDHAYIQMCYLQFGYECDPQENRHTNMYDTPFCGFKTRTIHGYHLPILDVNKLFDATCFNKDISPTQVLDKLESLFMLAAPDPVAASKIWMFTNRYVDHVLYDDRFGMLVPKIENKKAVEDRWKRFMSYESALLMYFPIDEARNYTQGIHSTNESAGSIEWNTIIPQVLDKMCDEYYTLFADQCSVPQKMRYGNYCGSNWSDGKSQASVAKGEKPAVDDTDECCRIHDSDFATATSVDDLRAADDRFVENASKVGFITGLAARAARKYNRTTNYRDYEIRSPEQKIARTPHKKLDNVSVVFSANDKKITKMGDMFKNAKRGGKKRKITFRAGKKGRKKVRFSRPPRKAKKGINRSAIPAATNFSKRNRPQRQRGSRNGNKQTMSGRIYLTSLTIPATLSIGQVLVEKYIAPQTLIGTTLELQSKMYEKYKFRKLEVVYEKAAGTTFTGQVIGFLDPDIRESYSSGEQGIRAAESVFGSDTHAVYTNARYKFVDKKKNPFYWTADPGPTDDTLAIQAKLVVQSNFEQTGGTTFLAGSYYIQYVLDLWDTHNQWSSITSMGYGASEVDNNSNPFATGVFNQGLKSAFELIPTSQSTLQVRGFRTNDQVLFSYMAWQDGTEHDVVTWPSFSFVGVTIIQQSNNDANESIAGWRKYTYTAYLRVSAVGGNFSVTQITNPTSNGSTPWSLRWTFTPAPANLYDMTPVASSQAAKDEAKLQCTIAKMVTLALNQERGRQKEETREGLPNVKHSPSLTDSEIDAFQKIEKLNQRSFSPSRALPPSYPAAKQ